MLLRGKHLTGKRKLLATARIRGEAGDQLSKGGPVTSSQPEKRNRGSIAFSVEL